MDAKENKSYLSGLLDIEKKPIRHWSLDDWVHKLHYVYGENNKYRSGLYLWLQITNEAGQLAENVRRGQITEALEENLVNLFGWLCGFVGKYLYEEEQTLKTDPISILLRAPSDEQDVIPGRESFSKWILQKYPGVCCACGYRFCVCSAYRDTFERRKENGVRLEHKGLIALGYERICEARRRYLDTKEFSDFIALPVDELIEEFITIYGGGHQDLDLWKIAAHFQEEVGEVSHEIVFLTELTELEKQMESLGNKIDYRGIMNLAFQKEGAPRPLESKMQNLKKVSSKKVLSYLKSKSAQTLKEELADVFSWMSAMLGKIGDSFRDVRKDPDQRYFFWKYLVKRYYPEGSLICPACRQARCKPECRAIFITRKMVRGEAKELNREDEVHEERIQEVLGRVRQKRVDRIAEEEVRELVRNGQIDQAIARAQQLYAEGLAKIEDYTIVLLSSIRETDWNTAWEIIRQDPKATARAYRYLAWNYWRLKRVDKAIEVSERGLGVSNKKSDILKFKNSLAYYYADARLKAKEDDAFKYAKEAVRGRPGDPDPLDTQGYVYIVFGKTTDDVLYGVSLCEKAKNMRSPEQPGLDFLAKHVSESAKRLANLKAEKPL